MEALRNMKSKAFLETKHENMTLLHIAAINEDLPMIQRMATELEYFKDVVNDSSNPDGWTPLLWAAQNGNLEVI